MKTQWKAIAGAVGAWLLVKILWHYYGISAALLALAVMVLCWFGIHLFYLKILDELYAQFLNMGDMQKTEWLRQMKPSIRKDVERRIQKGGNRKT
jgi:hypothetical protein